jgi:hypothetical protein
MAARLTLVKTASPSTYDSVGDIINYEFLVSNTGTVILSGPVTINDDKATDEACPAVSTVGNLDENLDVGESITCTASYPIIQADLDTGSVRNTARATAGTTNSTPEHATVNAIQTPALTLDKTATPTAFAAVGDLIAYSYRLTNSGNVTLIAPFTVNDDKATATCPGTPTSLAPGEWITCTASYSITQADVRFGNEHCCRHGFWHDARQLEHAKSHGQYRVLANVEQDHPTTTFRRSATDPPARRPTVATTLIAPFTVDDDKATVTPPGTPVRRRRVHHLQPATL